MSIELFLALPLLAALATFVSRNSVAAWIGGAACSLQLLLLGSLLRLGMDAPGLSVQKAWVPELGLNFALGVDGTNVLLVALTPLITLLALATVHDRIPSRASFCGCLLLLNGFLSGLFLSQNLGLFYLFFEAMLLPTLFLVAGWSVKDGRETALRFLMFTLVGSLPMLLAVLVLGFSGQTGASYSLDFAALSGVEEHRQLYLFLPFLLAFAIKMPLVPFHGWLPPLYKNAPATVIAVVAAMMGKAGAYGIYKVGVNLFPAALEALMPYLMMLALLTILYGAVAALGSDSLRGTLAFSSLSHMGMIALGLFSMKLVGATGSLLQMAAHALATGGLFLALAMFERRSLPDELHRLGGLAQQAPALTAWVLLLSLAALGQPGLGSFPGELMILTGTYSQNSTIAVVAALGIVLAAAYMLRWYQTIFTGEVGSYRSPRDLSGLETLVLACPVALSFVLGLAPSLALEPIRAVILGVL